MVRDFAAVAGDYMAVKSRLEEATILDGVEAFMSHRKECTERVSQEGTLFEWRTPNNNILIIPITLAEEILAGGGLKSRTMNMKMFSKEMGPDYADMKEGKIALFLTKHQVPVAVMIRKETAISLVDRQRQQHNQMQENLSKIEGVLGEAVRAGRGVDIQFGADGSMRVKIDPALPGDFSL